MCKVYSRNSPGRVKVKRAVIGRQSLQNLEENSKGKGEVGRKTKQFCQGFPNQKLFLRGKLAQGRNMLTPVPQPWLNCQLRGIAAGSCQSLCSLLHTACFPEGELCSMFPWLLHYITNQNLSHSPRVLLSETPSGFNFCIVPYTQLYILESSWLIRQKGSYPLKIKKQN